MEIPRKPSLIRNVKVYNMKIRRGFVTNSSSSSYILLMRSDLVPRKIRPEEALNIVSEISGIDDSIKAAILSGVSIYSTLYEYITDEISDKDEIINILIKRYKDIFNIYEDEEQIYAYFNLPGDLENYTLIEITEDEYDDSALSVFKLMFKSNVIFLYEDS